MDFEEVIIGYERGVWDGRSVKCGEPLIFESLLGTWRKGIQT